LAAEYDFRSRAEEKLGLVLGLARVARLVGSGTVKRPAEALVGSRIRQIQHCGDVFRNLGERCTAASTTTSRKTLGTEPGRRPERRWAGCCLVEGSRRLVSVSALLVFRGVVG
jgi:hypothetical protein